MRYDSHSLNVASVEMGPGKYYINSRTVKLQINIKLGKSEGIAHDYI